MVRITLAVALLFAIHPSFAQSPAFNTLVKDVWEDDLKRSPEFASALGDRRFNDQLSDLSARAFNERIGAERMFLDRLLVIDPKSLSQLDRTSADQMQRQFLDDQESAKLKPWELPINQFHDVVTSLPAQLAFAPFDTVKDYDDYIARLKLIPALIRQVSEDLLAGIDDHRVQPAAMLQEALKQTEQIAAQPPAESPFAAPLSDFPGAVDTAQRKRISAAVLEAIETDALPAYARFAKFLRAAELPAASPAQTEPQPYHQSGDQLRRTKIVSLLLKAQTALDDKLDLKAFKALIATNSALPLDVLEQRVDTWIAATK